MLSVVRFSFIFYFYSLLFVTQYFTLFSTSLPLLTSCYLVVCVFSTSYFSSLCHLVLQFSSVLYCPFAYFMFFSTSVFFISLCHSVLQFSSVVCVISNSMTFSYFVF